MKNALCFCGGGIKAIAHIGVIKALEDNNIKFDYVSGTSSGSIIASMYALNFSYDSMIQCFRKYSNKINYFDFKNVAIFLKNLIIGNEFLIDGLNSGDKLLKMLNNEFGDIKINQIQMPLIIPAVNLLDEKLYIFTNVKRENEIGINYVNGITVPNAIRASCSYPGVFSPHKYNNKIFVDGGIVENLPWKEAKKMGANKVLSIVFVQKNYKKCCNSIFQVLDKSFDLLVKELEKYEWQGTDYLLKIPVDSSIGLLKYKNIDDLFNLGYNETIKNINQIKKIFA